MRVLVETTEYAVEGEIVSGVPLEDGSGFDLDAYFVIRCDDGELVKVQGWNVTVQHVEERIAV